MIKNRLKQLRTDRQWSLSDLAKLTGFSEQHLNRLENHHPNARLNEHSIEKLADAFKVNIEDLFVQENKSPGPKHFTVDHELMQQAMNSIRAAAKLNNLQVPIEKQITYCVMLYNHVMKYRERGQQIEPNEATAELIMQANG